MKIKFLIGILSILLLAAGCSKDDEKSSEEGKEKQTAKMEQNKELTKKVKEEKGVLDGQVYTQDGMAVGTLILDKKVSNKEAKELAEKYVEELKEEYKDLKINVQAVRDGKNVANITEEE